MECPICTATLIVVAVVLVLVIIVSICLAFSACRKDGMMVMPAHVACGRDSTEDCICGTSANRWSNLLCFGTCAPTITSKSLASDSTGSTTTFNSGPKSCLYPTDFAKWTDFYGGLATATSSVVGPRPLDGRGVFCWFSGWGGVEMVTFGELAHMVDATQLCCLCPWTHARWYATMHHDGVGDGYVRWTCTHGGCFPTVLLVSVDTCSMLCHNASWWGGDGYVRWTCTHGGVVA